MSLSGLQGREFFQKIKKTKFRFWKIINFKYKNLDFNVPHVNLVYRNFVLFPLKEILPEWKHPKTNEPIDLIINKLSDVDKKSRLKIKKP